jgi:hypothetical protein
MIIDFNERFLLMLFYQNIKSHKGKEDLLYAKAHKRIEKRLPTLSRGPKNKRRRGPHEVHKEM